MTYYYTVDRDSSGGWLAVVYDDDGPIRGFVRKIREEALKRLWLYIILHLPHPSENESVADMLQEIKAEMGGMTE